MDSDCVLRAVVRGVADSYVRCERPPHMTSDIDVHLARVQHEAYCQVLEDEGYDLLRIPLDERFPDSCFVEDTSIVLRETAIITRMGAPSRRGEEVAVREVLEDYLTVKEIVSPGTVDGGDVLVMDNDIFIGVGERTNEAGVNQVRKLAGPEYRIIPVPLKGVLHLKSACTHVGCRHLLIRPGHFDARGLGEYELIEVPEGEAYAANCLNLAGVVLVSEGYPRTREALEAEGFETRAMEMSEFRKGHGSLTCLSVII